MPYIRNVATVVFIVKYKFPYFSNNHSNKKVKELNHTIMKYIS